MRPREGGDVDDGIDDELSLAASRTAEDAPGLFVETQAGTSAEPSGDSLLHAAARTLETS